MEKSNGNGKKPLVKRVEKFLTSDVWNVSESAEGAKKYFLSLLRIVLTTINGIIHKRILVQASSLSYATLLAIGPILAITVIFSGIFFRDKGEEFIYAKIMSAATFVMPAFNEMIPVENSKGLKGGSESTASDKSAHFLFHKPHIKRQFKGWSRRSGYNDCDVLAALHKYGIGVQLYMGGKERQKVGR